MLQMWVSSWKGSGVSQESGGTSLKELRQMAELQFPFVAWVTWFYRIW